VATSAAPPIGPGGDSGERLFADTTATGSDDDQTRAFGCRAWLQAGPDANLRAAGTVTVALLVDGAVAATTAHALALDLPPGARTDDVPTPGHVEVDAAGTQTVTCTVTYAA
jgi:hypothetical protein